MVKLVCRSIVIMKVLKILYFEIFSMVDKLCHNVRMGLVISNNMQAKFARKKYITL